MAAAILAKAGLKPLVVERTDRIGGCAITSEIAPGFRCPTLAHRAALDPAIVRARTRAARPADHQAQARVVRADPPTVAR